MAPDLLLELFVQRFNRSPFVSRHPTGLAASRWLALVASALAAVGAQAADCLADATPVESIEMRVLVLAADGTENVLPAIRNMLDHVGVPYDVRLAKTERLDLGVLCSGQGTGLGRYQGVMLTSGNLEYEQSPGTWGSALSAEEWARLWQYEAKYRVRQASMYTYPGSSSPETYGLGVPSPLWGSATGPEGLATTLTAAGKQIFPYLRPLAPVVWRDTWVYQAQVAGATALVVDANNNALVATHTTADGRQTLSIMADGNPYLTHTLQLGYGVIHWVTKGLYVGQRRVYMSAQPDDLLIADSIWDAAADSDETGKTYRVTARDYNRYTTWQAHRNKQRKGHLATEMPFNGIGSTSEYDGSYFPRKTDNLTPQIQAGSDQFDWLSHTYAHPNLDTISYNAMLSQLTKNDAVATGVLGLGTYSRNALVTPEISGLNNPNALRAMYDFGIRYLVSDTSKFCGHRNEERAAFEGCPRPNMGIYNDLEPRGLLMIPRYPANLFYNVSTPAEWTDEYNFIYAVYWGRELSYAEILDKESDIWLRYLISFDMRPLMFHQPNLRAYDDTHSLLGDLIDRTLDKYEALYNLPPESRRQEQIGRLMAERMAVNAAISPTSGAALTARIRPGQASSTIVLTNPTAGAVTMPITGVASGGDTEVYGGLTTSRIGVNGNGATVEVPGAPGW